MKKFAMICLLLFSPFLGFSQNNFTGYTEQNKWDLVWSDEFDYTGLPNQDKWAYEEGYFRRVSELQYYTVKREKNARVDGENLILEVHKETPESFYPTSKNDKWHRYTSASVNTRNSASWMYGRFEIRAKLPEGPGMWPAIWFLSPIRTPWVQENPWDMPRPHDGPGGDGPGGGESSQGELDLMEAWGSRPNRTYVYIHGTPGDTPSWRGEHERSIYDEFHVYAMEWYRDHIDFFRDEKKVLTFEKPEEGWAFDKRMYLLMNIAVGGPSEPAPPDENLPQQMVVDYVRVYELSE